MRWLTFAELLLITTRDKHVGMTIGNVITYRISSIMELSRLGIRLMGDHERTIHRTALCSGPSIWSMDERFGDQFVMSAIDESLSALNRRQLLELLDGVNPGEIPIGAVKRRSLAIQMNAQIFRIGRRFATNAFVLVRGKLRLVYVKPSYFQYRRVGLDIFGSEYSIMDFDHSLGRAVAESLNVNYVLLLAIDKKVNRGHGAYERVRSSQDSGPRKIDLRKHCFVDPRVMNKWLGLPAISNVHTRSYERSDATKPRLTDNQLRCVIKALGYGSKAIEPTNLTQIYR